MQIANKIRSLRESLGISGDDLARLIGTSRPAVYQWERGNCDPSAKFIQKLAVGLGVDAGYLLDDSRTERPEPPVGWRQETLRRVEEIRREVAVRKTAEAKARKTAELAAGEVEERKPRARRKKAEVK